jgi:large subunit ribosomal protein L14
MAAKTRAVSAKGVEEFRPYITRALPITAELVCADNTGAKVLRIAQVTRYKGRHSRLPSAAVGDFVTVTVKKGPAELRRQIFGAVIVRQKYPINRVNGVRVRFEDNAAVLVTPEGEIKGTDINGPVAAEAAEKWPRIANLAPLII